MLSAQSIGQTIAMAVVLLFVAFQILAYYGYVNVNWNQLGSSIGRTMDLTTESGRFDVKRVKTTVWGLITKIASYVSSKEERRGEGDSWLIGSTQACGGSSGIGRGGGK